MSWNLKKIAEMVGIFAVVLSLLLVAYEVRQANQIAIVNSEFALRNSFNGTNIALLTNPDMVEFLLKTNMSDTPLVGADEIRARAWIYLNLNAWVVTALAYEKGVATEETFNNVLDNIGFNIGRASPEMRDIWRQTVTSFPSLQDSPIMIRAKAVLSKYEQDN